MTKESPSVHRDIPGDLQKRAPPSQRISQDWVLKSSVQTLEAFERGRLLFPLRQRTWLFNHGHPPLRVYHGREFFNYIFLKPCMNRGRVLCRGRLVTSTVILSKTLIKPKYLSQFRPNYQKPNQKYLCRILVITHGKRDSSAVGWSIIRFISGMYLKQIYQGWYILIQACWPLI